MANATPRKNEVDLVVEAMESEEFEDAKAVAKSIVKGLYNEWRRREWYVIAHKFGKNDPTTVLYGMEPTQRSAEKFAEGMGTGIGMIVKVYPVGALEDRIELMHQEEWARRRHPCANCGHNLEHHGVIGFKGRPIKFPAGKACTLTCKCREFIVPEYAREGEREDVQETTGGSGVPAMWGAA